MEYRIKQGDDLVCSYTGKPSKVLIQLIDTAGATTQWLSREALLNADKLLRALEGIQEVPYVQLQQSIIPNQGITYPDRTNLPYIPPGIQITYDGTGTPPSVITCDQSEKKTDIAAAKAFEQACKRLIDDPPPDKNGNQTGVPGFAIREIIAKFKPTFSSPKVMYPLVQKYFPTDKAVIDFWLGIE